MNTLPGRRRRFSMPDDVECRGRRCRAVACFPSRAISTTSPRARPPFAARRRTLPQGRRQGRHHAGPIRSASDRHPAPRFSLRLIEGQLDYVIGNHEEWLALYQTDDLDAALMQAATILRHRRVHPTRASRVEDPARGRTGAGAGDADHPGRRHRRRRSVRRRVPVRPGHGPAIWKPRGRMGVAAAAEVIRHVGPRTKRPLFGDLRRGRAGLSMRPRIRLPGPGRSRGCHAALLPARAKRAKHRRTPPMTRPDRRARPAVSCSRASWPRPPPAGGGGAVAPAPRAGARPGPTRSLLCVADLHSPYARLPQLVAEVRAIRRRSRGRLSALILNGDLFRGAAMWRPHGRAARPIFAALRRALPRAAGGAEPRQPRDRDPRRHGGRPWPRQQRRARR